jgi:hypothetical protein
MNLLLPNRAEIVPARQPGTLGTNRLHERLWLLAPASTASVVIARGYDLLDPNLCPPGPVGRASSMTETLMKLMGLGVREQRTIIFIRTHPLNGELSYRARRETVEWDHSDWDGSGIAGDNRPAFDRLL